MLSVLSRCTSGIPLYIEVHAFAFEKDTALARLDRLWGGAPRRPRGVGDPAGLRLQG